MSRTHRLPSVATKKLTNRDELYSVNRNYKLKKPAVGLSLNKGYCSVKWRKMNMQYHISRYIITLIPVHLSKCE